MTSKTQRNSSKENHKYSVDSPGVWGLKSLTEIGLSDSETQGMYGNISQNQKQTRIKILMTG